MKFAHCLLFIFALLILMFMWFA